MPSLPSDIQRIHSVSELPAPRPHTKQRKSLFGHIVDRLTLVGQVVSRVEFANALLLGAVELLYDADVDGEFANFDIDGRVIVGLPWGSDGHKQWNVRAAEAKALRYIMMERGERADAWIVYRPESKGWYVIQRTSRHAYAMLKANPITNEEWRRAWSHTKTTWAAQRLAHG